MLKLCKPSVRGLCYSSIKGFLGYRHIMSFKYSHSPLLLRVAVPDSQGTRQFDSSECRSRMSRNDRWNSGVENRNFFMCVFFGGTIDLRQFSTVPSPSVLVLLHKNANSNETRDPFPFLYLFK